MAFKSGVPFDLNRIQKELGINEKRIRFCKLSEGELKEIYDNYTRNIPTLQKIKADIQADSTEVRIKEAKKAQGIGYVMKEAVESDIINKDVYEVELPINLPEIQINLVYIEKYLTKIDNIFIKKYLKD